MPSNRIKTVLKHWCVGEIHTVVLVVHLFGWGWTMLAGLLTSVVGFALLKRTGAATLIKLRTSFRGRLTGAGREVVDGALSVLGALALLLPGFLSDLVGIALLVRPVRDRVAALIGRGAFARAGSRAGRRPPGTSSNEIDLAPGEWRNGEARRAPEIRG